MSGYVALTHDGNQKYLAGTDGARLYFNDGPPLSAAIAQVAGSGGEVVRVPVPTPTMEVLGVSPDGATLLVEDIRGTALSGPLWALPVLGGSPRRLGEAVAQAAACRRTGRGLFTPTETTYSWSTAMAQKPTSWSPRPIQLLILLGLRMVQ